MVLGLGFGTVSAVSQVQSLVGELRPPEPPGMANIYIYIHTYIYIYMCVCVCVCMYICIYICVCVCVCIYVYIYVFMYICIILAPTWRMDCRGPYVEYQTVTA